MRTIRMMKVAILSTLLVSGTLFSAIASKPEGEKTLTLTASMTCMSCKNKIEKGMVAEKGVKSVSADLESKTVTIKYAEGKTTEANLVKAVEKLGFTASVTTASAKDCKAKATNCAGKTSSSGCGGKK